MCDNKIRAILFDYGGVIAEEGFYNGLTGLARMQSLDVQSLPGQGMQAVYDSGFVTGNGTAADFWALLRKRTGLKGNDTELTSYIKNGFHLRQWMIELVRKLRASGYTTGILSDQTHWLDELDSHQHFYREFDCIYNSYYLGKGKRDPSLFSDVADDLNLPPEEILFIDDNNENTRRAMAMGFQSIQYSDKTSFLLEIKTILPGVIES